MVFFVISKDEHSFETKYSETFRGSVTLAPDMTSSHQYNQLTV